MKYFDWNKEKNKILKDTRGVSFEDVISAIEQGKLKNRMRHPNVDRYPNQFIFYVEIKNYIYAVPFVEDDIVIFLKTIYPDRNATKKYLGGINEQ